MEEKHGPTTDVMLMVATEAHLGGVGSGLGEAEPHEEMTKAGPRVSIDAIIYFFIFI